MAKKCQEYITELNDYLDGDLDSSLCEEIEKHIGHCENCRIMVDTMRQTVKLCREGKSESLPPELENRLGNVVREYWRKKFGK